MTNRPGEKAARDASEEGAGVDEREEVVGERSGHAVLEPIGCDIKVWCPEAEDDHE